MVKLGVSDMVREVVQAYIVQRGVWNYRRMLVRIVVEEKSADLCRLKERKDLLEVAFSREFALYVINNVERRAGILMGWATIGRESRRIGRRLLGSVVLQFGDIMSDCQLYQNDECFGDSQAWCVQNNSACHSSECDVGAQDEM